MQSRDAGLPTSPGQVALPGVPQGECGTRGRQAVPLRRKTDGSLSKRTTRAEMGDSARCWFNSPSPPSNYRSDQIGLSEFSICRVDESGHKSDLMRREGSLQRLDFHPAKTPGMAICNLTALWAFPPFRAIFLAYGTVNARHIPGVWGQRQIAHHG